MINDSIPAKMIVDRAGTADTEGLISVFGGRARGKPGGGHDVMTVRTIDARVMRRP